MIRSIFHCLSNGVKNCPEKQNGREPILRIKAQLEMFYGLRKPTRKVHKPVIRWPDRRRRRGRWRWRWRSIRRRTLRRPPTPSSYSRRRSPATPPPSPTSRRTSFATSAPSATTTAAVFSMWPPPLGTRRWTLRHFFYALVIVFGWDSVVGRGKLWTLGAGRGQVGIVFFFFFAKNSILWWLSGNDVGDRSL